MTDDDKALVEAMKDAVLHGTGFFKNGKHVPIDDVYLDPRDARIEALSAENERLREAMEQVSVKLYDVAEFMDQAGADAQTLEAKNEWLRKALGEVLVYAPDFIHGVPKKNYEKLANGEL